MNNFDKIKLMDVWQLAEILQLVSCGSANITICGDECKDCECSDEYCISNIAEWLIIEV